MSTMQNYKLSKPPCNCQKCKSETYDPIQGEGRTIDKAATRGELQLEDSCLIDPYDIHDHDFDEDPEWVDYEAPYRTETPHA